MKRALFDTVSVLPCTSGASYDRTGFESAILAISMKTKESATVKVEHADTLEGEYAAVGDSRLFVDNPVNEAGEAVIKNETEGDAVANLDIDLIGCKRFIKVTVTTGTAVAIAFGDATDAPTVIPEGKDMTPSEAV